MRFRVLLFAVTCMALAFSATAFADPFAWHTTPILGIEATYDGNVVVNTGPTPYIIPHSTIGDPDYVFGMPSMTVFMVGQSVATGSGMWVNPGDTYTITGIFQQLTGGARTTTYSDLYTGTDTFIMETFNNVDLPGPPASGSALNGLGLSDVGNWSYTETWNDATTTLTATNLFRVDAPAAVPEPSALILLGTVLLGLAASRKLKLT